LRIGIFGGTFNPIHNGHLINAQMIKGDFSLDFILFIPSKMPVHKGLEGNVNSEERYEMVKLAIEDNSCFKSSRIEIDRKSPSYTKITIKELQGMYKDNELFFILGIDAFNELNLWKDYKDVMKMIPFIVMNRLGSVDYNKEILGMIKEVIYANNLYIDISSSYIRERIKIGESIKYLVPKKVEEYIRDKGLYIN